MAEPVMLQLTDNVDILTCNLVDLARLSLLFGRTPRVTFHPDGKTHESDTDHTVMLALAAGAIASSHHPELDLGLVVQFAVVHDLVEAYAGDTSTLRALSDEQKTQKKAREHAAYLRILAEFNSEMPWLPQTIATYEEQQLPEARFVRAVDKLLPKLTHMLNACATLRKDGLTLEELRDRYDLQEHEMHSYAADFPILLQLRKTLVGQMLDVYAAVLA